MRKPLWKKLTLLCFLASAILIAIFASIYLLIQNRNGAEEINLPDEKEVVSIRAVAYKDTIGGTQMTPQFSVPSEYIPVVLGALTPAATHERSGSSSFPPVCDLQITTKSDMIINVRVEWSGQNPIRFSMDGVRYMRSGPYCLRNGFGIDESLSLRAFLEEVYLEQTTHTKSELLPKLMKDLEWSTGKRKVNVVGEVILCPPQTRAGRVVLCPPRQIIAASK